MREKFNRNRTISIIKDEFSAIIDDEVEELESKKIR